MAFQGNGLRDAFEGQGEAGFIVYSYATFDPLELVLASGYFTACRRLAVGDLIFVGTRPRPVTSAWMAAQKQTPIRRALLMVAERDTWGQIKVRLVQDYGGPGDGDAPVGATTAPTRRGRGRPPKSTASRAAACGADGAAVGSR